MRLTGQTVYKYPRQVETFHRRKSEYDTPGNQAEEIYRRLQSNPRIETLKALKSLWRQYKDPTREAKDVITQNIRFYQKELKRIEGEEKKANSDATRFRHRGGRHVRHRQF